MDESSSARGDRERLRGRQVGSIPGLWWSGRTLEPACRLFSRSLFQAYQKRVHWMRNGPSQSTRRSEHGKENLADRWRTSKTPRVAAFSQLVPHLSTFPPGHPSTERSAANAGRRAQRSLVRHAARKPASVGASRFRETLVPEDLSPWSPARAQRAASRFHPST